MRFFSSTYRLFYFDDVSKGLSIWPGLQRTSKGVVAEEPFATAHVCGFSMEFLVYWMFLPLKPSSSPVSWQKLLSLADDHR